jgi:ornithine cyclodeaminase/alanine dehydrogenase-like protein (mu-crystallin family)
VTTTPSHKPYLEAEWLYPGLHITAVGADAPEKQEIEARALGQADRIACDLKNQSFVRGELHHAMALRAFQRGPK